MNQYNDLKTLITAIDDLLDHLGEFKDCTELLSRYKGNDWKEYKLECKKNYKRKLIHRNKRYEIILISWYTNQSSPIHDHAENGCVMRIMEGMLKEIQYCTETLDKLGESIYQKDHVTFIDNNKCFHKITNIDKNMTYSIHIYSPPCYKTIIYDI